MDNQKTEETNAGDASALSPTVKPLKSAAWMFPLCGSDAYLFIVATPGGEICPDDMDALAETAALIKRQLERRAEPDTPRSATPLGTRVERTENNRKHYE